MSGFSMNFRLFPFLCSILFLTACSTSTSSPKLTIAAAANMQFAIKALTKSFTQQTGIKCDIVISSSGKLTAQIKEGAPYDIFLSADQKYPNDLYQNGFSFLPPAIYAYGKLMIWTTQDDINPSLDLLIKDKIEHIAIANPKTAPYGRAALEVIRHFELENEIKDKLVFGESIAQVNQFITTQSAELGFTATSLITTPEWKSKGQYFLPPEESYQPIAQAAILLNNRTVFLADSQEFFNFLFSDKAKDILENYGYFVDKK